MWIRGYYQAISSSSRFNHARPRMMNLAEGYHKSINGPFSTACRSLQSFMN